MANQHVCPWWIGYLLASPLRRLLQDPAKIVAPYVRTGMIVLEPGPGMGFFTLELARRVGAEGRVVAVDIQPRMLAALQRRVAKAGLKDRVETRLAQPDRMGVSDLAGKVDFALVFAVVHEMPRAAEFFNELSATLAPKGVALLVEPAGHVSAEDYHQELASAAHAGLSSIDGPKLRRSHAAVLRKDA